MHRLARKLIQLVLCLASMPSWADTPPAPPQVIVTCSRSGVFCAVSDPSADRTTVRRRSTGDVLWVLQGWHPWVLVSDDGESLAVSAYGMNLVQMSADLHFEVIRIYQSGKLKRSVQLRDFFSNVDQLPRTVSHRAWVSAMQINEANQLVVELINGERRAFSMATGRSQPEVR